nr:MAG TPA: hypothetical protein [Caudoviricetes sp.]
MSFHNNNVIILYFSIEHFSMLLFSTYQFIQGCIKYICYSDK